MERQLIISQEQFKRLNEGMVIANDENDAVNQLNHGASEVAFKQPGKTGNTYSMGEKEFTGGTNSPEELNANTVVVTKDEQPNYTFESISLNKIQIEDARKKSRMIESGDKVYSKASFIKKLNEDYKEFNNRLVQKRKNYGK